MGFILGLVIGVVAGPIILKGIKVLLEKLNSKIDEVK